VELQILLSKRWVLKSVALCSKKNSSLQQKKIIDKLSKRGASLPIISDVVCGKKLDANERATTKNIKDISKDDMIFDLGKDSVDEIVKMYSQC
jgi:3-phosphoglycerate kinase